MHTLLLVIFLSQPAPKYKDWEPVLCHPEDAECVGPVDLNPLDRRVIFIIMEEMRRQRILRERNANLPVCPVEPGYWWNLECA